MFGSSFLFGYNIGVLNQPVNVSDKTNISLCLHSCWQNSFVSSANDTNTRHFCWISCLFDAMLNLRCTTSGQFFDIFKAKGRHFLLSFMKPFIILTSFFKFLLNQGSFCGATDYSCFGLCVTLHMGFKARVVLSLHIYLLASGEPKGHI